MSSALPHRTIAFQHGQGEGRRPRAWRRRRAVPRDAGRRRATVRRARPTKRRSLVSHGLRHHSALACDQLPSSTTSPLETGARGGLVGQGRTLAVERHQWALLFHRLHRTEIEHAPILGLGRLVQCMAEIAPRQADRERRMGKRLANQSRVPSTRSCSCGCCRISTATLVSTGCASGIGALYSLRRPRAQRAANNPSPSSPKRRRARRCKFLVFGSVDAMDLLSLYRTMARIRAFELAAEEMSIGGVAALGQPLDPRTKVRGPLHVSIGQEAIAAGVCAHLASTTC